MQNLNDLNKLQEMQKTTKEQIPNLESAGKPAPSKFDKFVNIALVLILISVIIISSYIIISDDIRTKKQIQAGFEEALNSPKIQEYRAKEAKRQREIAKKKRLREMGINGVTKPVQKNDLLNEQLRKQEIARNRELLQGQENQDTDYASKLATYNARLKEVQEHEERIRLEEEKVAMAQAMEREQALREQAEQLRLEKEQQAQEKLRLADERAKATKEQAEKAKIAKIKAAREKAAKLKAQAGALKTQKNTLKTSNNAQI